MHILIDKLYDFSEDRDADRVLDDLLDKYHITNLVHNTDAELLFSECIWRDYKYHRANYDAYIEPGMDARLVLELRKNAVIPLERKDYWFFEKHSECKTVQDVVDLRTAYFSAINPEYLDIKWQYYCVLVYLLRCVGRADEFDFDYECCLKDGDMDKQTTVDQYEIDFVRAHMDGYHWLSREACDAIGGRWID